MLKRGLWENIREIGREFFGQQNVEKICFSLEIVGEFLVLPGGGESTVFSQKIAWAFICWCKEKKNLKAETVKQYLGAIKKISKLLLALRTDKNGNKSKGEKMLGEILLRGYKNMERGKRKRTPVKPVNLTILREIHRNMIHSGLSKGTRLAVWAACVLAFWGSFRLAEILPSKLLAFDKFSDLLWNDIHWKQKSVLVNIKQPKVPNGWSDTVEIFQIPATYFCPRRALKKLMHYWDRKEKNFEHRPVFRTSSGKILTKGKFLKLIRKELRQSEGFSKGITGKSFRSGLPSELENFTDDFKERHIKILGRWKSNAYQSYIRKGRKEKKRVIKEIANTLLSKLSMQDIQRAKRSAR